jgi:hypothetical protein
MSAAIMGFDCHKPFNLGMAEQWGNQRERCCLSCSNRASELINTGNRVMIVRQQHNPTSARDESSKRRYEKAIITDPN